MHFLWKSQTERDRGLFLPFLRKNILPNSKKNSIVIYIHYTNYISNIFIIKTNTIGGLVLERLSYESDKCC